MNYVLFKDMYRRRYIINRNNIVGFSDYDPMSIGCYVLLDSGSEISLSGVELYQAKEILAKFDEENK